MLFLSNKSIPLATNHTLRISAETEDVSHKVSMSNRTCSDTCDNLCVRISLIDDIGHPAADVLSDFRIRKKLSVIAINR